MIEKIIKFLRSHTIDLGLAIGSVILTSLFHWVGIFDFLELKTYDYRFHTVRGPLTGWRASDSTIIKQGTDVVLVEVDDESWRILKENKVQYLDTPSIVTISGNSESGVAASVNYEVLPKKKVNINTFQKNNHAHNC